jgi:hypothetical protein
VTRKSHWESTLTLWVVSNATQFETPRCTHRHIMFNSCLTSFWCQSSEKIPLMQKVGPGRTSKSVK